MASYSEEYKIKCVAYLELFQEKKEKKEKFNIDEVQINNVRELVAFLNISSFSLYKWQKEIVYKGNQKEIDDEKDELDDDMGFEDCEPFVDEVIPEAKQESQEQNGIDLLTKQMEDIGYWQSLARALGLKNYRQKTSQLKLRIGMELINGNSLVKNNVRKEMRIE